MTTDRGEFVDADARGATIANMLKTIALPMIVMAALTISGGCTTAPKTQADRDELQETVALTIADARKQDPSLQKFFDESAGYAVFPRVGKGALGVGGAYGKGMLYENGQPVGYCDLTQGSIGFQVGGQAYSELIFFETVEALEEFKSGDFAFAAQATAVALKSGAAANAKYDDGVAVFTFGQSGLMAEAAIGGQKFDYLPM